MALPNHIQTLLNNKLPLLKVEAIDMMIMVSTPAACHTFSRVGLLDLSFQCLAKTPMLVDMTVRRAVGVANGLERSLDVKMIQDQVKLDIFPQKCHHLFGNPEIQAAVQQQIQQDLKSCFNTVSTLLPPCNGWFQLNSLLSSLS